MKPAYWIVTGVFCLLMLAAAALETFRFAENVDLVTSLGYPAHVAYILPITKILGVSAILARRFGAKTPRPADGTRVGHPGKEFGVAVFEDGEGLVRDHDDRYGRACPPEVHPWRRGHRHPAPAF